MGQAASSSSLYSNCNDPTVALPDECLAWIFSKLSGQDRNRCSLVCKRWSVVDSKSRQRLVLAARSDITPSLPALLSRFSSLSTLSLKCSRKLPSIDDHALACIPDLLPSLKKLKLKGCAHITDSGLHAFALHRPPRLSKLSFASCGFGGRGIVSLLLDCPSLRDLTLKRLRKLDADNTLLSPHSDHGCSFTHEKNKLERLCLKDLHNARLFVPLLCSSASTLKTLIVCRSSGRWDGVLESLQGEAPTSIVDIQMENVQLGDLGLIAISKTCPDLQVLYLSRASDCTDDGLSAIANSCRKLRKLHIDACSRFGSRTIEEEGLMSIATKCSNLQELVLMGVPITLVSLNVLASNCLVLERMALCNIESLGDSEMQFIGAKFSALKKLCIRNCPISDSGVKAIGEGCPNLVKLKVKRCRGVTHASAAKLRVKRAFLIVSVDSVSTLFDGEELEMAENEAEAEEAGERRITTNSRSTRTNVLCSSRGALLLRSKFHHVLKLNSQ